MQALARVFADGVEHSIAARACALAFGDIGHDVDSREVLGDRCPSVSFSLGLLLGARFAGDFLRRKLGRYVLKDAQLTWLDSLATAAEASLLEDRDLFPKDLVLTLKRDLLFCPLCGEFGQLRLQRFKLFLEHAHLLTSVGALGYCLRPQRISTDGVVVRKAPSRTAKIDAFEDHREFRWRDLEGASRSGCAIKDLELALL